MKRSNLQMGDLRPSLRRRLAAEVERESIRRVSEASSTSYAPMKGCWA